MSENSRLTKTGWSAVIAQYRWFLIQAILIFLSAGQFDLPRAWLYLSVLLLVITISTTILVRKYPDVMNNRADMQTGTKAWDKIILPIFILTSVVIIPIISGLDAGRYSWSKVSFGVSLLALGVFILASFLTFWAMTVNRHFESSVRIQTDRDHTVISSGPYQIVRHPGYLAMILTTLCMPVAIGSLYGLIPAGLVVLTLIIRTALEDKTLQQELYGYEEYTQSVKYRIFPGVW